MASAATAAATAPLRGAAEVATVLASSRCALARAVPSQRRWYTAPSRRSWSKQHYRIRVPRPLAQRFDISREHPEKEWWRERRIAPATFFGFPDVTKHGLRGGQLYVEQMDAVTLAVLGDKCVKEDVWDPEIWERFSWRAQQIASRTHEPELCYIFRAFARADWFDQNLLTTYLGRLHRRLHNFQLPDVAVLLEAFVNPRFRLSDYLRKALLHLVLLLQHRDDAKAEDLARTCAALAGLWPQRAPLHQEVAQLLELLAEALLLRDLADLGPSRSIAVMDCYVTWGLFGIEQRSSQERAATAAADLCWALARELLGQLRDHSREKPEDLATLAMAMGYGSLQHGELWEELCESLEHRAHKLSGPAAAMAAYGVARGEQRAPKVFENLARTIRLECDKLSPLDTARAAWGLIRGGGAAAVDQTLLLREEGPLLQRVLELGLDAFDAEALTVLFGALAWAPPWAQTAEVVAGTVLEALHGRLAELSVRQLCMISRTLGHLRPEAPEVLADVLDRAQAALVTAAAEGELVPQHVALLCLGIAGQPKEHCDVPGRLQALLPQMAAVLEVQQGGKAKVTGVSTLTAAQLVRGLAGGCPASRERDAVLDKCAEHLAESAASLPAEVVYSLLWSLAALANGTSAGAWRPPAELLETIVMLLDMKRYDFAPGTLCRASEALEACGWKGEALKLEPRDQPAAADAARKRAKRPRPPRE